MNADKKRIWIKGRLIEVTEEVYDAYMKGDRKMRYFESDLKAEQIVLDEDGQVIQIIPSREDSLDRLMDDHAKQFADPHESVEETVFRRLSVDRLRTVLRTLPKEDRQLIYALYFEKMTEQQTGRMLGITQQGVHKRKNKILGQLKKFLEN